MSTPRKKTAGLGAVEAVMLLALLGTISLALAHGVLTSRENTKALEDDARLFAQARVLMNRLSACSFGSGNEGAAPIADLLQLITVENSLYGGPLEDGAYDDPTLLNTYFTGLDLTLSQLRPLSPLRWTYETNGRTYFGPPGTWEIVVSRDLNGDGDTTDALEVATQTNQDLVRVEIRFEGRRLLRTLRSRLPAE